MLINGQVNFIVWDQLSYAAFKDSGFNAHSAYSDNEIQGKLIADFQKMTSLSSKVVAP
jgi:hypothetical protein